MLHELWVHGVNGHEKCLHGGVVGNAASSLMVAAHAITEDLHTGAQGIQELVLIINLTILVTLYKEYCMCYPIPPDNLSKKFC